MCSMICGLCVLFAAFSFGQGIYCAFMPDFLAKDNKSTCEILIHIYQMAGAATVAIPFFVMTQLTKTKVSYKLPTWQIGALIGAVVFLFGFVSQFFRLPL